LTHKVLSQTSGQSFFPDSKPGGNDPTCLTQIRNLLDNGYDIEFSLIHREAENLNTSEGISALSS
jgi:hypothetical protein